MATTTFSVAPSNVGPNGITTPGLNLPANTYEIVAYVNSPDWDTTTGTVAYTIQLLIGAAWQDGASDTLTMGSRGKDGNLPHIAFGSDSLAQASQLRLKIACNPRIKIGGDITIYSDYVPPQ